MANYPDTPIHDDKAEFPKEVLKGLQEFKERHKYGHETWEERAAGMTELLKVLNHAYKANVTARYIDTRQNHSFMSYYRPEANEIVIQGKLSIITFLHEYGHALDWKNTRGHGGEHFAVLFSVSLFKRIYPRAYAKLTAEGHTLTQGGKSHE